MSEMTMTRRDLADAYRQLPTRDDALTDEQVEILGDLDRRAAELTLAELQQMRDQVNTAADDALNAMAWDIYHRAPDAHYGSEATVHLVLILHGAAQATAWASEAGVGADVARRMLANALDDVVRGVRDVFDGADFAA